MRHLDVSRLKLTSRGRGNRIWEGAVTTLHTNKRKGLCYLLRPVTWARVDTELQSRNIGLTMRVDEENVLLIAY